MPRQSRRDRRRRPQAGVGPPRAAGAAHSPLRVPAAIAVVVATCIAYAPALRAPLELDDVRSIATNASIRTLWPPSVPLHPPPGEAVSGRPVANLSLALNYAVNELLGIDQREDPDGPHKAVGFHLGNILLHLLSGALLFGIVRRTLRHGRIGSEWVAMAEPAAGVVTLLWLLHPIQSEAVNYLVQRTELLVSACYLGTLYASIRAWDARGQRTRFAWFGASAVTCLLGMGSKEVMISAPLVVMLYDRAFRRTSWRELLGARDGRPWFYLVLVTTSAWLISLVLTGARASTVGFHLGITWPQYLYSQAWAIARYIQLAFWPSHLTFDYGQDPIHGPRGIPGLLLLAVFGLATVVAWTRANRWGSFAFLGAWFFLILGPSSSFVPIRTEIAAERRFYLPLISILVLAVAGTEWLRRRALAEFHVRHWWHAAATADRRWAIGTIGVLLAAATFQRSATYADAETLWRDTVAKAPDNPRAYDNLAAVLVRREPPRYAEAESLLRRAIALDSAYMPAWPNLALIVGRQGRLSDARQLLERALTINPDYVLAVKRLGILLVEMGQSVRAIPYLERVAGAFPDDECLVALGHAYLATGRLGDAATAFGRALALNPDRADAMTVVGGILTEQGRGADALPYLEGAIAHGARDPGNYILAGRAMLLAQRPSDAERYLAEAVRLGPADPEAVARLGIAKAALGKGDEARALFQRALTLRPDYEPARRGLAGLERR